jgi:hypothetical protein
VISSDTFVRVQRGKAPGDLIPLGGFVFQTFRLRTMTDEKLADLHKVLAEYHRRLGKGAVLDVVQRYHSDLAQRLSDEAALIPRRTAIVERLHKRERKEKRDYELTESVRAQSYAPSQTQAGPETGSRQNKGVTTATSGFLLLCKMAFKRMT